MNLSINIDLMREAKALGINVSAAVEAALSSLVAQRKRELWLEQSQQAIEAYNLDVQEYGTLSDGLRGF